MMTTKHKHYDLILAWANGAEIQYKDPFNMWYYHENPIWLINEEYRIKPKPEPKPEPKPDIVLYAIAYPCNFDGTSAELSRAYYFGYFDGNGYAKSNIKLTYDGETKELKSVEVI